MGKEKNGTSVFFSFYDKVINRGHGKNWLIKSILLRIRAWFASLNSTRSFNTVDNICHNLNVKF